MTVAESQKMILQLLKNVMEDKISKDNVEVITIRSDTRKMTRTSVEDLETIIATLS